METSKRCEPCCGMGYKGRWRRSGRNGQKVWKIETCRACTGTGQVEVSRCQRAHKRTTKEE